MKIGLFSAIEIGNEKVKVSHLQYPDDTIFNMSVSSQNAWAMRRILRNSELLSGLKINYNKYCLMGLNVDMSRLQEMATILV